MFIVARQAPIAAKPAERALGHPTAWQDFEALGTDGALDDFQRPAEVLADITDDVFVRAVSPDQLEPAPAVVDTALVAVEERLQSQLGARRVLHPGAGHDHQQQETQRIHHNMPFSAARLLVDIHAPRLTAFGRLHALTVDAGRAGLRLAASLLTGLFDQQPIDELPFPTARPAPKIAVNGLPWGKILRQHAPLAASAISVHDGVDDQPHVPLARPA